MGGVYAGFAEVGVYSSLLYNVGGWSGCVG